MDKTPDKTTEVGLISVIFFKIFVHTYVLMQLATLFAIYLTRIEFKGVEIVFVLS